MRILHVSMGIPPFRVGGLNEYCLELMEQQVIDGHEVGLLYPGEFGINKSVKIVEDNPYYFKNLNGLDDVEVSEYKKISLYKIKNPLPLALVFGINDPKRYMAKCDKQIYIDFINKYNPEIIHIHCIQGIHKEFYEAAHMLNKKMVFTTHDYYPICPKCTLYNEYEGICQEQSCEKCAACNISSGFSKVQEIVMQSKVYSKLKYSKFMKIIRCKSRKKVTKLSNNVNLTSSVLINDIDKERADTYNDLLNYYKSIMNMIDLVHCNSDLAKSIYKKHYPNLKYCTIPITRKNLGYDTMKIEYKSRIDKDKIIIGYVGGVNANKGLKTLVNAVLSFKDIENINWELHLYGGDYTAEPLLDNRIISCGFFDSKVREKVYSSFDVLVVPSLWPETFGFIVPEALSVGTPVICSDLVGSKDCIQEVKYSKNNNIEDSQFIYKFSDTKELANKILNVVRNKPSFIAKKVDTISEHSKNIENNIYL